MVHRDERGCEDWQRVRAFRACGGLYTALTGRTGRGWSGVGVQRVAVIRALSTTVGQTLLHAHPCRMHRQIGTCTNQAIA